MGNTQKQSDVLAEALKAAGDDLALLKSVAAAAINVVTEQEGVIAGQETTISGHEDMIAEHEKTIAGHEATIADQDETLTEAGKFNAELQKKLETLNAGGKVIPSFTYKGDLYNVLHGVNLEGKVYTPQEIAENSAVAKQLVDGNSSAVELQPDEDDD